MGQSTVNMFGQQSAGGLFGSGNATAAAAPAFGGASAGGVNANKDFDLTAQGGPTGSISTVCTGVLPPGMVPGTTTPTNVIGCGSWDGTAYVWVVQVNPRGQNPQFMSLPKAEWLIHHKDPATQRAFPILDCCFTPDQNDPFFFTGSCDGTAKCMRLQSNSEAVVAKHDKPIRIVRSYRDATNAEVLATGSWDGTVKFWEMSKVNPAPGAIPTPSHSIQLQERVFAMDVKFPVCVIGTADNMITVYDLRNPAQPHMPPAKCQLTHQLRTLSVFPDQMGYAVGSVEGRVGITYFQDPSSNKAFAFRCHREQVQGKSTEMNVFPVNSIAFHQQCKTFATAGADGCYNFWDKDSKQCLKKFAKFQNQQNLGITSGAFSPDGAIYAYSTSYDWLKGKDYYVPDAKNQIWLHYVIEEDVKPRPAATKFRR